MQLNRFKLAKYLLREQGEETEEDLAAKLEEPEEPEEPSDELEAGGEEFDSGEQGGENAPEASGKDNEEEVEEDSIETSTEDKIRLKDSIDDELQAVFMDFESDALKSKKINTDIVESKRLSLKKVFLLEFSDPNTEGDQSEEKAEDDADKGESSSKIDINSFAADVARLIKNYDSLLDLEAVIFNKAKQFLLDKYNDATYREFKDIIVDRHGIDFLEDKQKMEDPVAVGAKNPNS